MAELIRYNTKSTIHKRNIDKVDFIKIKKMRALQRYVEEVKTSHRLRKMFANRLSMLMFRMNKELLSPSKTDN